MSISIKLISKKLGFLSPAQPVMFSRKHVLLLQRRCLTSQTQSSYVDKSTGVQCLPTTSLKTTNSVDSDIGRQLECICYRQPVKTCPPESPGQFYLNTALKRCTTSKKNTSDSYDLDKLVRLSANPCFKPSHDIALQNNYLTYNTKSEEGSLFKLQYSSVDPKKAKSSDDVSGKPSDEQLLFARETLAKTLPRIFLGEMNYGIYHKDIVFINNIRGYTTQGFTAYIKEIAKVRIFGHIQFAYVRFDILKITSHPEDGTVRVRWRICGVRGYKILWNLVRYRIWRPSELMRARQDTWLDGFSTYFVGGNGQIYKHVADKVMPDDNQIVDQTKRTPLAPKLAALFVGLAVGSQDGILSFSESQNES